MTSTSRREGTWLRPRSTFTSMRSNHAWSREGARLWTIGDQAQGKNGPLPMVSLVNGTSLILLQEEAQSLGRRHGRSPDLGSWTPMLSPSPRRALIRASGSRGSTTWCTDGPGLPRSSTSRPRLERATDQATTSISCGCTRGCGGRHTTGRSR